VQIFHCIVFITTNEITNIQPYLYSTNLTIEVDKQKSKSLCVQNYKSFKGLEREASSPQQPPRDSPHLLCKQTRVHQDGPVSSGPLRKMNEAAAFCESLLLMTSSQTVDISRQRAAGGLVTDRW